MPETSSNPLRLLIALPGMHRVNRGAEVAFESIALRLARRSDIEVTLVGAGPSNGAAYCWKRVRCVSRDRFERWPKLPFLRNEGAYEELITKQEFLDQATEHLSRFIGRPITVTGNNCAKHLYEATKHLRWYKVNHEPVPEEFRKAYGALCGANLTRLKGM